jgi:hypothetical protein
MINFPYSCTLPGNWEFTYTKDISNEENPAIPDRNLFTAQMPVPAYWDDQLEHLQSFPWMDEAEYNEDYQPVSFNSFLGLKRAPTTLPDGSLPFLNGVGWYRKELIYPNELTHGHITLEIGGVSMEAWVWLNGKLIEYHLGHSTPFAVRLDKNYQTGKKNELIVAVRNTRRDRLGFIVRGWKGYSGGINRPVKINFAGEASIKDIYVQPACNNSRLIWNVELEGTSQALELNWQIKTRFDSKVVKEGSLTADSSQLRWETDSSGIKEWSDTAPELYDLKISISKNGNVLDRKKQIFGLRSLVKKGINLQLNGRPVILRGATEHCFFPLTCKPPFDIESYREMLQRVKVLGFNWVRFHTWVPSEEYLQAADELGMMIQVEPPVGYSQEEWLDIIKSCRKHPSVVIYCCGNEELLDEDKIAYLKESAEIMHREVPEAVFNPQEALRGIEYSWNDSDFGTDLTNKPFKHNPSRLEKLKEFSDVFGQYGWGGLSYASAHGDWHKIEQNMEVYERPCLAHEVGIIGTYMDFDLEHRYENTRIGTDLYSVARKGLKEAGLFERWPLYYRNSSEWARLLRKQAIENVRKCKTYAGYDYLGAIDHHNHQIGYNGGFMNEFYELKSGDSVESILRYNGESVLLLDCSTARNFACGQSFKYELFASLYGGHDIKNGELCWLLLDSKQNVILRDNKEVKKLSNGQINSLGSIEFKVPELDDAGKYSLVTRLSGGKYELENDWDFWFYPQAADVSTNDIIVTSSLDNESLDVLQNGGKVVLLGSAPFPASELDFQISKAGRVHGNSATVINKHPLTDLFPHEGFCSWQFYSMFTDGSAVNFNEINIPFNPIIEVASTYKDIVKQSCMFELKVGNGNLFVCSLNLNKEDAGAEYLKAMILKYAASSSFDPETFIELSTLKEIFDNWTPESQEKVKQTVQAFDPNAQLKKK